MISSISNAHEQHEHLPSTTVDVDHAMHAQLPAVTESNTSQYIPNQHEHKNEHGGQIYSTISLDQTWLTTTNQNAELKSENELKIGTDEHKLVLQLAAHKAESESTELGTKLLYSRMISDFWDIQTGFGYQEHQINVNDLDQRHEKTSAILGLHGLAPYFFESSAYLSLGKKDYVALNFEVERDILITQKWITQPYLEMDFLLNDHSKYAEKSGVREASIGLNTRYEISKQLMPYFELAYRYEQETEWNNDIRKSHINKDWIYGVGMKLKF